MFSVIITTNQESKTLPKAIKSVLGSIYYTHPQAQDFEILVVGPDQKTEEIVNEFSKKYPPVRYLKDKGRGKPAALNMAFKAAKGKILILTDGDVWIDQCSVKEILRPLKESKIGAVTGQPISINSVHNLFGYWSHFLTHAAHQMRLKSKTFPCSGYLYAFRNIISSVPENSLAEDAVITQLIREKGYQVVYTPQAKVQVKYPNNLKDWLKQKIRSTGGYTQKQSGGERNLGQEILAGLKLFFTYPKNSREFFWTILL
ncbi:glycosyltransferase, partial [Patescibacteria group bacterium]|nr:glycosyltransferase [Patescibacteria group bacterium]